MDTTPADAGWFGRIEAFKTKIKGAKTMAKYKLLQVENKVTYRGFIIVPLDWERKVADTEVGEFLKEDSFEDQESEVWDEWTIDVPDDVENVSPWQSVSFEDYKQFRVKDEE